MLSTHSECHVIMRKFDFIVTHFQLHRIRLAFPQSQSQKLHIRPVCGKRVWESILEHIT